MKISKEYGDKTVHLVLGNAMYQKCKAVRELVSTLNIHLEYIPPYSPNLNLIERLWKLVKREELRTEYYDDFIFSLLFTVIIFFKERIDSIIDSTTQENHTRINNLIGEKIQLFDNLHLITKNTHEVNNSILDDKCNNAYLS